jgi:type I restriction enzyme S subunit
MYLAGRTWKYQNQSTGIANFQFDLFAKNEYVRLPAYDEQIAIAKVLGDIDDLQTNLAFLNDYLAA